jgi:hypothetical protein
MCRHFAIADTPDLVEDGHMLHTSLHAHWLEGKCRGGSGTGVKVLLEWHLYELQRNRLGGSIWGGGPGAGARTMVVGAKNEATFLMAFPFLRQIFASPYYTAQEAKACQ